MPILAPRRPLRIAEAVTNQAPLPQLPARGAALSQMACRQDMQWMPLRLPVPFWVKYLGEIFG